MSDLIVKGATQNNLKSVDVTIPDSKITVVVGPSGSGKSSLVFDTIYAEGQRRYIESLSSYVRQFLERIDKPAVDYIENISPTIAVEQRNRIKSSRGTVGTITEIYEYLRMLFSKIGKIYCPECNIEVKKYTIEEIVKTLVSEFSGKKVYVMFKFKGTKQELLMAGFMRVFFNDVIYDLSEQDVELPEEYFVVYDRFEIAETETNRMWESVERVVFLGHRVCSVYFLEDKTIRTFNLDNVCSSCGKSFSDVDPRLFSFDSPIGACPDCKGFGNKLKLDESKLVPDPNKSILGGALEIFNKPSVRHHFHRMVDFLRDKGVDVNKKFYQLTAREKKYIYEGGGKGKTKYPGLNYVFDALEKKKYKVYIRVLLSRYKSSHVCDKCNGTRLVQEALNVKVQGKNISELHQMCAADFYTWLGELNITDYQRAITKEVMKQLFQRTSFVNEIGLGYLTLNRLAKTLSNGEAQRINLANQLGSSLVDTIYVLDEPSIGLHPRDVDRLMGMICKIRDNGNKVIVVEHDPAIIKAMDHVIELGPQSGAKGGHVVFSGSIQEFLQKANTITSRYLKTANKDSFPRRRVGTGTNFLIIKGLKENNLKNLELKLPLNRFICVTGVSGSGKSSLVTKSVYSIISSKFDVESEYKPAYSSMSGMEHIDGIMLIDQEPLTRTQRSTPITFISGFDYIRECFAQTPLARSRGYTTSNFSFNVESGACPTCGGDGFIEVDMSFMADIYMRCETCGGTRYKREILDVNYKGKNISEVLAMTVEEAYDFFISSQHLRNMLKLLMDVGLEYLVIGQPAGTLSGGEAQRLKICKELVEGMGRKKRSHALYIMDEPTTGLHPSEVERLVVVLQKLVNEGNTVLVVEHNMDLIKHADYIVDLGPDAGQNGGRIIAHGSPEEIALVPSSYTGKYLKEYLND